MCHVDLGWGSRLRRAVVAAALMLLASLALSAPLLAADPPPIPRPDPPPRAIPPPPPQVSEPPAPQPVAPVVVTPAAAPPVVVQPTAESRAAAARPARLKAARVARELRIAADKLAPVRRSEEARTPLAAVSDTSPSGWGVPFLLAAFGAGLLLLGLAVTPARAVPWSRVSRALDDRRDELGVMGAMGLAASLVFFLLVQVTT